MQGMDPNDLDLWQRCGELCGVVWEETGLQVEVLPARNQPSGVDVCVGNR
jgi:hypothetical protein